MKQELLERRETLLKHMVKGSRLKDVLDDMTKAIPDEEARTRAQKTIAKDWEKRSRWMPCIIRLNDSALLLEIVASMREVLPKAWVEYAKGDNSSARVGALKIVLQTNKDLADLLMNVGAIQKVPVGVNATVSMAGLAFEVDPEIKKILLDSAERQRREKICQSCNPESKKTCLTPGDPGPNCGGRQHDGYTA